MGGTASSPELKGLSPRVGPQGPMTLRRSVATICVLWPPKARSKRSKRTNRTARSRRSPSPSWPFAVADRPSEAVPRMGGAKQRFFRPHQGSSSKLLKRYAHGSEMSSSHRKQKIHHEVTLPPVFLFLPPSFTHPEQLLRCPTHRARASVSQAASCQPLSLCAPCSSTRTLLEQLAWQLGEIHWMGQSLSSETGPAWQFRDGVVNRVLIPRYGRVWAPACPGRQHLFVVCLQHVFGMHRHCSEARRGLAH